MDCTTQSFFSRPCGASSRPLAALLLTCGIAGIAGAAETKIRDVRLVGGAIGQTDTPEITFYTSGLGKGINVFANEDDTRLEPGPRAGVELFESFGTLGPSGGFLLGLGYAYSHQQSKKTNHDAVWLDSLGAITAVALRSGPIEANVNAVDLHFGYAFPLTRQLDLELRAFAGIGSLTIDDRGAVLNSADHPNGPYHEFGARAALIYACAGGFVFGVDAGYLVSHGRSAMRTFVGDPDDNVKRDVVYEIDYAGPMAEVTVGWRF
jgi:hypothetical protein